MQDDKPLLWWRLFNSCSAMPHLLNIRNVTAVQYIPLHNVNNISLAIFRNFFSEWTVRNYVRRSEDKSAHRWHHEQICGWMYRLCQCLMWQLIWSGSDPRALRHTILLLSQSFNLVKRLVNTNRIVCLIFFISTNCVLWRSLKSEWGGVQYSRDTSRRRMWKDAKREEAKTLSDRGLRR